MTPGSVDERDVGHVYLTLFTDTSTLPCHEGIEGSKRSLKTSLPARGCRIQLVRRATQRKRTTSLLQQNRSQPLQPYGRANCAGSCAIWVLMPCIFLCSCLPLRYCSQKMSKMMAVTATKPTYQQYNRL